MKKKVRVNLIKGQQKWFYGVLLVAALWVMTGTVFSQMTELESVATFRRLQSVYSNCLSQSKTMKAQRPFTIERNCSFFLFSHCFHLNWSPIH